MLSYLPTRSHLFPCEENYPGRRSARAKKVNRKSYVIAVIMAIAAVWLYTAQLVECLLSTLN